MRDTQRNLRLLPKNNCRHLLAKGLKEWLECNSHGTRLKLTIEVVCFFASPSPCADDEREYFREAKVETEGYIEGYRGRVEKLRRVRVVMEH